MAVTLVGRSDTLRSARSILSRTGILVLAGASGVGKTALARALLADHESVIEIRGTHGLKSVPFAALGPLLPEGALDDRENVPARVVGLVGQAAEERYLLVDDAHLLDEQSAAVLSQVTRSDSTQTVLTVTTGEPVPPDLVTLWAEYPECRIELQPLGRVQVGEMVTDIMHRRIPSAVLDEIADITLGYPLYIAALVAEMRQLDLDIPSIEGSDRLVGLLERRLGRLNRDERRLFDLIAFAESLPLSALAAHHSLAVLEDLERSGLVDRDADLVRVSHPLLGTVARSTLTRAGLRACAYQLVDGITPDIEAPHVSALVRKALAVGVVAKADHLETAARYALQVQDFQGAATISGYRPEEPSLVAIRAKAMRYLGDVPDPVPVDLDDDSLTDFVSARAQAIAYGEGRYSEAIDLLVEGMNTLSQADNRDRIALELVILTGLTGDVETLLEAARAVSADVNADTRLLALSSTMVGEALTLSTSSSAETYREALRLIDDNTDPFQIERLEMANAMVHLAEGRLVQARSLLRKSGSQRLMEGSWLTIESVLADAWMEIGGARQLAQEAVAALEQFDALGNLPLAKRMLELRVVQMGLPSDSVVEASADLSQADELMSRRIEAWSDWKRDPVRSGSLLAALGREAVSLGHRLWGLLAFLDAARLGNGEDVVAEVEQLVISRGAGLALPVSRHARAETAGELWQSVQAWFTAGAPTYASEVAIRAAENGSPIYRAGVQMLSHLGATPLVGDVSDVDGPLSERQVEVALGVVAGHSNEELAEQLFLSRRTIENHLHRLYSALELDNGREGLIAELGWLGG